MKLIISPAKSLRSPEKLSALKNTTPHFIEDSEYLISKLNKLSVKGIMNLMGVSENIAQLNHERFSRFQTPFTRENAKTALLAFDGDVYKGMLAEKFTREELNFAQSHIRILSGLYGILKPLDLMQDYRLEMGTKFKVTPAKNNLYKYWDKAIFEHLDREMNPNEVVINLASNEYFKSLKIPKDSVRRIIQIDFKENRVGDEYKMISFLAKKARGMMCRYVVKNKIETPEMLKGFDYEDYTYNKNLSSENKWAFTR